MKYGQDRIRITCYDENHEKACSIVVGNLDIIYICEGSNHLSRRLEIADYELYHILRKFLDNH